MLNRLIQIINKGDSIVGICQLLLTGYLESLLYIHFTIFPFYSESIAGHIRSFLRNTSDFVLHSISNFRYIVFSRRYLFYRGSGFLVSCFILPFYMINVSGVPLLSTGDNCLYTDSSRITLYEIMIDTIYIPVSSYFVRFAYTILDGAWSNNCFDKARQDIPNN